MATRVANESLAEVMDRYSVEADPALCWAEGDRLRCVACGHRCLIGEGLRGICKVRVNEGGRLKVPFGYIAGLQCDPVEKKPFFHVFPSSDALTFGMLGCDLHCSYCQNWVTSQALRDRNAVAPLRPITPAQLVEHARRENARLVVSSYNEPLITAEWAVSVFREAGAAGLACAFVSNGNATPEVLDYLRPWIVAYKVDLKSFSDRNYRSLGGTLDNITKTIEMIHERGIWLEVVTLIIPGFNDNDEELRAAARFLASVSADIPWHVTAFHKDYRMTDPDATSPATLMRAAEMGRDAGLRFVYAGNLPGQVSPWEDTRCPSCQSTVIERYGYLIRSYRLEPNGRCPNCQTQLPGIWPGSAEEVRTGNDMAAYRSRLPRRVETGALPLPVLATNREGKPRISLASVPATGSVTVNRAVRKSTSAQGGAMAPSSAETTATPKESGRRGLVLSDEQKQRIIRAAGFLVRSYALGHQAAFEASDVSQTPLSGAFVSLKRNGHLRSCCGMLGQSVPLAQAVEQAAFRSVWDDARFPPVSPGELEHLEMEVWLLDNPEPVQARGEDRLAAVTVGKHGVQVIRGQAHGLFLPSVALDNDWDARRFLEQVCVKAGLPPSAWKEDATRLLVFEGQALHAPLSALDGPRPDERPPFFCRPEDLPNYTQFCRQNIAAHLMGSTPSYYLWGAPDGNLTGAVLQLRRPDREDSLSYCQLSLRPGVPLQATLTAMAQSAAQGLAAQGIDLPTVEALHIDLMLLHDPMLHGTVADPDYGGLDPTQRALLVMERNKASIVFDPQGLAEDLLADAARQAHVAQRKTASFYSLEALSTTAPLRFGTAPRPHRGPAVRPPAVAGTFYDADPAQLAATVDQLLAGNAKKEAWPAAMVPHAGLRFSGRIAADVLKRIDIPTTVLILGPKHTNLGMDWAVAPHQTWELPGGGIDSDFVMARRLCQAIPGLEMDAAAHQREHGVEVELPLLARLAPQAKVVGIAIGHGDLESCRRFAAGLAAFLREQAQRPLLLISSDMNHFANDEETRRLDALALDALERGDPAQVYEIVTQNQISMCGVLPAVIVLETLQLLGAFQRGERVSYATSADVTGDTSRVVGYAGMLFGS